MVTTTAIGEPGAKPSRKCRSDKRRVRVQRFRNGLEHYRLECGSCGKYVKFLSRSEAKAFLCEHKRQDEATAARIAAMADRSSSLGCRLAMAKDFLDAAESGMLGKDALECAAGVLSRLIGEASESLSGGW
jgi:hypothetical protein